MKEAYIKQEADRIPFVLDENVEVGDIIKFGSEMVAIAGTSGLAGETITVYISGVVAQGPAKTEDEIKVGDMLFWNADDRVLTTDNGGDTPNNPAGHAITVKAQDVAGVVEFLLNK